MTTGLWGLVHLPLRWRVFVSVAILLLLPPTFAPPAASAARKTKPASEAKSPDQQAGERLAEAWSAFVGAIHTEQCGKAKRAFMKQLRRYPDSRWTERVRTKLLPKAKRQAKESER